MVIDLTEDLSDDQGKATQTSTQYLLSNFTRRPPPPQPLRLERSASRNGTYSSSDSSSTVSSTPSGPRDGIEVVVKTKSDSVATESTSSRKRRYESISSPKHSPLPEHHGMSDFYKPKERNVESYPRAKTTGFTTSLGRPRTSFCPSKKHRPVNQLDVLRTLYEQKLTGIAGPPVVISWSGQRSDVDFNFEFINDYKLHDGVERVDANFNAGCECENGSCDPAKCACLSQEVNSDKRIVSYKSGRDGLTVLRLDFMKRRAMIYECSTLCSCDERCWNRVVQRGRTVRLEIFQTLNRGFGLRSFDNIQAGQYIDSYLGEVITQKEALERESAMAGSNTSYLFSLDFFSEDDVYVVDGRKYGSVTRFMNHSCNPNCKLFSVSEHHADEKIFTMAFFALKDIPAGTELTFDYCPNASPSRPDPEAVKCLCGEANCRGQLWANQRKTMQAEVS